MANITKQGIPDRRTKGAIGDIYTDANTGKKYKCTGAYAYNTYSIAKAEYEWRPIVEDVVEKKTTPSDNKSKDSKIDKVVEPVIEPVAEKKTFEEPDISPTTPVNPIPERRQGKTNGKANGKNYGKYYQQKKDN